jgi:hypothetical protein
MKFNSKLKRYNTKLPQQSGTVCFSFLSKLNLRIKNEKAYEYELKEALKLLKFMKQI